MTRVTNVYRRFRSNQEIPLAKPRYTLGEDGSLRLIPTPIKRLEDYHRYLDDPSRVTELGANDDWYQPAVYRDPLYDYSATLRLLTQVWIVGERRFGAARILQEGEFNPESPAFRIQLKLFEAFSDSVRSRGAWPLIVLFPDQGSIAAARAGKGTVLSSLAAALREQHLDFVDLTDAFREAKSERVGRWFMPAGHYSAEANQVVAFWLGSHLPSVN